MYQKAAMTSSRDQIGEHPVPPGPFDAHLVVVALQHAALVLLVDELVQVRIEHGQIGQLVVDRADLISFPPGSEGPGPFRSVRNT